MQLDEPEVHFRYSYLKDFAAEAIDRALRGVPEHVSTAVHVCYGYSKNIAEKRATPVYPDALEVLAASAAQWVSLEYEQPQQQPDLLEHLHGTGAILGLLNLDTEAPVETVDHVLERARAAIEVVGPQRLSLAPDCGMWFLPREKATAKAAALEARRAHPARRARLTRPGGQGLPSGSGCRHDRVAGSPNPHQEMAPGVERVVGDDPGELVVEEHLARAARGATGCRSSRRPP